jgi:hypothetical protein
VIKRFGTAENGASRINLPSLVQHTYPVVNSWRGMKTPLLVLRLLKEKGSKFELNVVRRVILSERFGP